MPYASNADRRARKPFRWWYDAIIDWRLANPAKTEAECAAYFGTSSRYLRVITSSDMFIMRWNQRRQEHSERLSASIHNKLLGALDTGLDIVQEQLKAKRTTLPFEHTTKFVNTTLAQLGYGPAKPGVQVNVGVAAQASVQITQTDLAEARELLRKADAQRALEPPSALPQVSLAEVEEGEVLEAFPLEEAKP